VGRTSAHYSPTSGKVHGSDYTVRDVCSTCNSDYLSALDAYFCSLYDAQLSIPKGFGQTVSFQYNYDLLCRALLKIAYNTARSVRDDCHPFARLTDYILYGGTTPPDIAVFAEIVSPTVIVSREGQGEVRKEILPTMYRSARGGLLTPHGKDVLVRIVAVNSFFFHVLIKIDEQHPEGFAKAVQEFGDNIQGVVLLSPGVSEIQLHSSPQDSLSSLLPLLKANRDQYNAFFQGKDAKKISG